MVVVVVVVLAMVMFGNNKCSPKDRIADSIPFIHKLTSVAVGLYGTRFLYTKPDRTCIA